MSSYDPTLARQFAVEVVSQLRKAGHEAFWAGGCVRDQLLGKVPKDYDVATSALPEQIRETFGQRRTLAIGVAFGVITVLGPKGAGSIEVATFRHDLGYSDGRRPDSVAFTNAQEDACRRDFTINGIFFDPLTQEYHDYVGGQEDLQHRVLRAIGNPHERFAEDRLRMLRAVRFSATLDFELDPVTQAAVRAHASAITVVSGERIAAEMRRMLKHASRAQAVEMLREVCLLDVLLPELAVASANLEAWKRTLSLLQLLEHPSMTMALAALMREVVVLRDIDSAMVALQPWKLPNEDIDGVRMLLRSEPMILQARQTPWPQLQRTLVMPRAAELVDYCAAVAAVLEQGEEDVQFCREKLALPSEIFNPIPLITGDDLKRLGIPPGPAFKEILDQVRDEQLLGQITTSAAAIEFVRREKGL